MRGLRLAIPKLQISENSSDRQTAYSNYEDRGKSPPSIMLSYLLRKFLPDNRCHSRLVDGG